MKGTYAKYAVSTLVSSDVLWSTLDILWSIVGVRWSIFGVLWNVFGRPWMTLEFHLQMADAPVFLLPFHFLPYKLLLV